jgi:hypothetical protein
MIKCLVVDDEKHAIEILIHYIGKMPMLTLGQPAQVFGYDREVAGNNCCKRLAKNKKS